MMDVVNDGNYILEIVSELLFSETKSLPKATYTDSKLYDAIKSKKSFLDKRLRINIPRLREMFK